MEQEKYLSYTREKAIGRNYPWRKSDVGLTKEKKDFKLDILNMFKDFKKNYV